MWSRIPVRPWDDNNLITLYDDNVAIVVPSTVLISHGLPAST